MSYQAAETAAYMTVTHPDYAILAARIAVSNLHKQTKKQFSAVVSDLYHYINPKNKKPAPMISKDTYECVMKHAEELNSAIVYDRDFNYQYFGFKTLERSYLLKIGKQVAERPQHMLMRVSVGIHGDDIERAIETYNLMSQKFFTHASPTLFNAGTPQGQLASCFLIDMKEDSIEGIYDTLKICAMISKNAGGIGLNTHCIRATGSYIGGTNGSSNGLTPMLRVFNNTARYVDQGGNKRPGAFAIYLEPWHADVFDFLNLRKNHGKEEGRARDLFYALWTPDLFMKRVEKNLDWTLFALMRPQAWQMCMVTSSKHCTRITKKKAVVDKLSKHRSFGMPFLRLRPKPAHRTCSTKMPAIGRAIKRTLELSEARTFAPRLLNTVHQTRSQSAILPRWHSQPTLTPPVASMTLVVSTK